MDFSNWQHIHVKQVCNIIISYTQQQGQLQNDLDPSKQVKIRPHHHKLMNHECIISKLKNRQGEKMWVKLVVLCIHVSFSLIAKFILDPKPVEFY